jgi:hypothetical protein
MSPYMFRPCLTDIIRGFFSLKHLCHSKESVNFYSACQVCPKLFLPPAFIMFMLGSVTVYDANN